MISKSCKGRGHSLKEVKAVVGYKCNRCDYEISLNAIPGTSLGMYKCPRCKAEGKIIDCNFYGSERVKYHCGNCGYDWVELM